jgi:transcriptional regulator with XRE-family HTH domain
VYGEVDGYEAIGRWLLELRGRMTQPTLARRLGVSVTTVWRAEKGKELSAPTARAYDAYFSERGDVPKGAIIARRDRLEEAYKRAVEVVRAGVLRQGGVSPSDRRGLLQVATTPFVAEALDRAEKAYQTITVSTPDPWTLDQLAEDAVTIAARHLSTPLNEQLHEVFERWKQCADMLDRGPIGAAGQRVFELAGRFAYYAAQISFHTGDRRLVSAFGTLAERYAEVSRDPLLIGSVACLRSGTAFDSAQFTASADIAGRAAEQAHPYTRARLFAYQARGLAADGQADQARDALADMRAAMVDLPLMPGAQSFNEGTQLLYSAIVFAELGEQQRAEAFAREMVAGTPAEQYKDHGLAQAAIGKALAGRDPGAAADAGLRTLDANRMWPSVHVESRVRRLHRDLAGEHGDVAEVIQLGEAVATLRRPAAVGV